MDGFKTIWLPFFGAKGLFQGLLLLVLGSGVVIAHSGRLLRQNNAKINHLTWHPFHIRVIHFSISSCNHHTSQVPKMEVSHIPRKLMDWFRWLSKFPWKNIVPFQGYPLCHSPQVGHLALALTSPHFRSTWQPLEAELGALWWGKGSTVFFLFFFLTVFQEY